MDNQMEVKISVRDLVEFILRSGSIDSSFIGSNRAVEGTRIHQKIQRSFKEGYESEVVLKYTVNYKDFLLTVEGRADGIIHQNDMVIIDEIKTTTAPLEMIDEHFNPLHWAQAKCYAYIYAEQYHIEDTNVRLTYYQLDLDEIKYIDKCFSFDELKTFFQTITDEYYKWAKKTFDWNVEKIAAIKDLKFPYEDYRKGQREMAVAVYKTIENEKNLFAQAPTGIGKTISAIFPAIKAMGEGHTSKIFYLTAKTITRTAAQDAFSIMREKGLKLKYIILTAKEKICFNGETICTPEECIYASGHFDRVNAAIDDILSNEDELSREIIEEYAKKHKVCPFEFSLDLTLWADAIICDYNYVFDPSVYLKRFFMDRGGDYTVLIDEAHNLVDRSREMFSAELYKRPFLDLKRMMKEESPKISKELGKINKFMLDMGKLCGENGYFIVKEPHEKIYALLKTFMHLSEEYLLKHKDGEVYEKLLQLYFDCVSFTRIWELYDERYTTYVEKTDDDVKIKLFCLDPSYQLREVLKKCRASVFFSATLLPMGYHRNILGGSEEDYGIYLDSPFSIDNRRILIADNISTRYRDREQSYGVIADYIKAVISAKAGNYMVFFPSYQYMDAVYDVFIERYSGINAYAQLPGMTEKEREKFLEFFRPNPEESGIGFCVLGGIYSEGIDLKYDRLIGVIIVGVGLPQICLERNIIREYFEKSQNLGYAYAYMYPGMNKVLQAAGRLIRSEEDKGIILLIDDRFKYQSYQRLFPKEWFPYMRVNELNIDRCIKNFWREKLPD